MQKRFREKHTGILFGIEVCGETNRLLEEVILSYVKWWDKDPASVYSSVRYGSDQVSVYQQPHKILI